jgi:hypothetical protein
MNNLRLSFEMAALLSLNIVWVKVQFCINEPYTENLLKHTGN